MFCLFIKSLILQDVLTVLLTLFLGGKISQEVLRSHISPVRTLCYLCGPPPMIESVSRDLQNLGLSMDKILFEKWW